MENPFDLMKESEKAKFFDQMTSAINTWMLKEYPGFDNLLVTKIKALENIQQQIIEGFDKWRNTVTSCDRMISKIEHADGLYGDIRKKVEDWIKKEYPELLREQKQYKIKYDKGMKSFEKLEKDINDRISKADKIMENLSLSQSLCEDVYKMRDQMKQLDKDVKDYLKKIKGVFN